MKEMCRENELLAVNGVIEFIQDYFLEWLGDYIKNLEPTAAPLLEQLYRKVAYKHEFSKRVAAKLQENAVALVDKKDQYCSQFWKLY